MDLDKIGLRERKKAKQKVDLLLEFIREMKEKQVYEIRISDVCKKAFVSDMVFYNYFEKKENAVFTLLELWYVEFFYLYEMANPKKAEDKWKLYADFQISSQSKSPNFTIGIYTTLLKTKKPEQLYTTALERFLFFQEFRFYFEDSKDLSGIENIDLLKHNNFFEMLIKAYLKENNIETTYTAQEIECWAGVQHWGVGTYCSYANNFDDIKQYYYNMLKIFFKN